jgi:hypothetical protein
MAEIALIVTSLGLICLDHVLTVREMNKQHERLKETIDSEMSRIIKK